MVTPLVGALVLGLYAAALTGIGLAVGGILGTRYAATVTVVFVIVTWFIQLSDHSSACRSSSASWH